MTIPHEYQVLFNGSKVPVVERMSQPVESKIIDESHELVPDFRRAYDEDGLDASEFDAFGATARTLRGLCSHYHELPSIIRDEMIPSPEK